MLSLPGRKLSFATAAERERAGRFGMALFLTTLAILFGAMAVGYFVVRWQLSAKQAWPGNMPRVPLALGLSTIVLVASSVTVQLSLRSVRRGSRPRSAVWMAATFVLGIVFLLMQAYCWEEWRADIASLWEETDAWRFALTGFYVMTGLHGAHVIGGLIFVAWAIVRLRSKLPLEDVRSLVLYVTMYWHFLDVVWIGLYLLLHLGPQWGGS